MLVDENLGRNDGPKGGKGLDEVGITKFLRKMVDEEVGTLGALDLLARLGSRRGQGVGVGRQGRRAQRPDASSRRSEHAGERCGGTNRSKTGFLKQPLKKKKSRSTKKTLETDKAASKRGNQRSTSLPGTKTTYWTD